MQAGWVVAAYFLARFAGIAALRNMRRREDEQMSFESKVQSPKSGSFRRYAGIYAALWKNSVTRETMFKGNFLMWIVVELAWFALQLGFISVLYLHTEQIGTWTKWQVVLLVGASHFIQQIFQAFFR